jgi:hypothetical protein
MVNSPGMNLNTSEPSRQRGQEDSGKNYAGSDLRDLVRWPWAAEMASRGIPKPSAYGGLLGTDFVEQALPFIERLSPRKVNVQHYSSCIAHFGQ